MDLESLQNLEQNGIVRFTPQHTNPTIICANCGKSMESKGIAICEDCVRLSSDITKDIQKSGTLVFCRKCGRLQVPPNSWTYAPPESRELLSAILKRMRGLSKLRLIDARFLWTEPHSRRLKLKITVQGEVQEYANTVVQQTFNAEFVESGSQCPACAKSYTNNTWVACVQLRQRVAHKRTFYYLEQVILKHKANTKTVSIQENKEGLDFFFDDKKSALKMVEFLQGHIPAKVTRSEEFISQDTHTSKKTFKFTYTVDIIPISRDDLIVLPKKLANSLDLHSPSRLVLCRRVTNTVQFIDPTTLETAKMTSSAYYRNQFPVLDTPYTLTEYIVLDCELTGVETTKFALADVTVARSSDLGKNDTTYYVRSHLGGILHAGDTVMGYDLENTNWNHELWDGLDKDKVPSVILVKKINPDKKKNRGRNWRLKRLAVEHDERESMKIAEQVQTVGGDSSSTSGASGSATTTTNGTGSSKNKQDAVLVRQERDYEDFLEELEQDAELRTDVNIYIRKDTKPILNDEEEVNDDNDDDDLPEINISEMKLDDDDDDNDNNNNDIFNDDDGEEVY